MSESSLIGKAKELQVASLLVEKGYYVYFPLVDNGFDLVVTNKSGSLFLPVQVKYKETRTGFTLKQSDVEKFKDSNVVLAFGSMDENDKTKFWFIPFDHWYSKSENRDRKDKMRVVYFKNNLDWTNSFLNEKGIKKSFTSQFSRD